MKEAFRVLGSLAALSILSASALAAPAGAVATPDGRTIITAPGARVVPRQVQSPMGGKNIVNTFNSDTDNAYNCCSGWTISAEGSPIGARQDVAMPFTPSTVLFAPHEPTPTRLSFVVMTVAAPGCGGSSTRFFTIMP